MAIEVSLLIRLIACLVSRSKWSDDGLTDRPTDRRVSDQQLSWRTSSKLAIRSGTNLKVSMFLNPACDAAMTDSPQSCLYLVEERESSPGYRPDISQWIFSVRKLGSEIEVWMLLRPSPTKPPDYGTCSSDMEGFLFQARSQSGCTQKTLDGLLGTAVGVELTGSLLTDGEAELLGNCNPCNDTVNRTIEIAVCGSFSARENSDLKKVKFSIVINSPSPM